MLNFRDVFIRYTQPFNIWFINLLKLNEDTLKRMLTKKFNVGIYVNTRIENESQEVLFSGKEGNLIQCLNYVHSLYLQCEEITDIIHTPVVLEQQIGTHYYILDYYLKYRPEITNYNYEIIE